MIFLDTNYLIRGLVKGTNESEKLLSWQREGITLTTNSLVWCEFVTGPISDEEVDIVWNILGKNVHAFSYPDTTLAARLYNALGRPRNKRIDIMIAASAMNLQASLATANTSDFTPLSKLGLLLLKTND